MGNCSGCDEANRDKQGEIFMNNKFMNTSI